MSLKFGLFLLFAFFSLAGGSEPLGCLYCATPSVRGIQTGVRKRDPMPDDLLWRLMPTESWGDPIFADDCGNLGSERKSKYGQRCAVLHLEYEDGRVMHLKGSTSTKQEGYFNYTKEDGANGWAYVCSYRSYCNMRDVGMLKAQVEAAEQLKAQQAEKQRKAEEAEKQKNSYPNTFAFPIIVSLIANYF
ncbi:unnamed protein product, partial [Mesorhabditis spiculigera]